MGNWNLSSRDSSRELWVVKGFSWLVQLSKTDIGNVQIQLGSVKYDLGRKMGIYRRDRIIRWIGDVTDPDSPGYIQTHV